CGNLSNDSSFQKVAAIVGSALADGVLTEEEKASILAVIDSVLDVTEDGAEVVFDGRSFCLSGNFTHGSKAEVEQHITSRGGSILKSVTRKCDYVVVGELGSDAFSFGNFGAKVAKARELQDSGLPITVIPESGLY
ncbi:MAG: BRCT domain-containing protein, partial [Propionibacteriaceae bacterium]|nr:BRCT domain-containing protein [Propionibacteriaceae bacterium]